ncbi:DUF4383 domain-containing protein [Kineococcus sp. SYSU DK003]|uniref:DUF4383 domain-containing protein n=1 Tax=Kineococcus sp. SYSU DK003 TaxID=3383124 RepID=UPI003D7DB62C
MNVVAPAPAAIEAADTAADRGPVTRFAKGVGVLVLGLGVLGLVPGLVTDYASLGFFHSEARLFGIFTTSVTASSLQILFGLTVLAFSGSTKQAHKAVVWVALAYLAAGLGGAGLDVNAARPDVPVNPAVNWLHLVLFVVILVGASASRRKQIAQHGVF